MIAQEPEGAVCAAQGALLGRGRFLALLTGSLQCVKCGEQYETTANYLTEPIDVFGEWLDEIAAVNDAQAGGGAAGAVAGEYEEM